MSALARPAAGIASPALALAAALLASAPTLAAGGDWRADVASSRLEFSVTLEGAPITAVFRQFDAKLSLDPARPAANRLAVAVVAASVDTGSADVDRAVGAQEWFDFARFPSARFEAADVRPLDANRYVAHGDLTLKGTRRPVDVVFTWQPVDDGARVRGELVVDRREFAIGTGEWSATRVVGAAVKIRFDLRLRPGPG